MRFAPSSRPIAQAHSSRWRAELGSLPISDGSSLDSQWYYACSNGGETKLAYGDDYEAGKCIDAIGQRNAGSKSGCHGVEPPFDQVFDLSGSLWESEDSCEDAPAGCRLRGSDVSGSGAKCYDLGTAQPNLGMDGIGFRCCAD